MTHPTPPSDQLGCYYESENYMPHNDEKRGLMAWCYQRVRAYMLCKKWRWVTRNQNQQPLTLLDVGAGSGTFAAMAHKKGLDVMTVEPSKAGAQAIERQLNKTPYESIELIDLAQPIFDVITMWHSLEHIYNLDDSLAKIKQLLKPNGKLIIAVPNCSSYDAQHYQHYWAAYDVPRHLWHFTPNTMSKLLSHHHLSVDCTYPMFFDAFYISMLSEGYKHPQRFSWLNHLMGLYRGSIAYTRTLFNHKQASSIVYIISHAND